MLPLKPFLSRTKLLSHFERVCVCVCVRASPFMSAHVVPTFPIPRGGVVGGTEVYVVRDYCFTSGHIPSAHLLYVCGKMGGPRHNNGRPRAEHARVRQSNDKSNQSNRIPRVCTHSHTQVESQKWSSATIVITTAISVCLFVFRN